jgi:hypothetical protein
VPGETKRPASLEDFVAELRQLRRQAGEPSFRQMANRSGAVSHATLHLTVTGHRLQPWETVREFVRACDGDETAWQERWQQTRRALDTDTEHAQHDSEGEGDSEGEDTGPDSDDVPHQRPGPDERTAEPPRRWRQSTRLLVPLVVGVVVAITATAVLLLQRDENAPVAAGNSDGVVHEGDSSQFLADVTFPDGTVVRPGEQFVKVWLIRNDGTVHWHDRYLERIEQASGPDDCRTPDRVPINDTAPQQTVQISVTVRAPVTDSAICKVYWKMVDESGRELLPGYRPIFFEVRVRR